MMKMFWLVCDRTVPLNWRLVLNANSLCLFSIVFILTVERKNNGVFINKKIIEKNLGTK